MQRYVDTVPGRLDRRLRFFLRLVDIASRARPPEVELQGFRSRIHLYLTGEGGGDIGIFVGDNRVRVGFKAPRPPDAMITIRAQSFSSSTIRPPVSSCVITRNVSVLSRAPTYGSAATAAEGGND